MKDVAFQCRLPGTRPRGRAAGFTLAELVVTLALAGVLLTGLTGALVVGARALPRKTSAASVRERCSDALGQMIADVATAQSIVARSDRMIEFTVPDRDSDGQPEHIRYEWSGTADAPLLRTLNGGAAAAVVDHAVAFRLEYDFTQRQLPPTSSETAEQLLASYDTLISLGSAGVSSSTWWGQNFTPTLPADAVKWRVTRVSLSLCANGDANGTASLQIRLADSNGFPTGAVLNQVTIHESSLTPSHAWYTYSFSDVGELAPDRRGCIVLQWLSGMVACDARIQIVSATSPDTALISSMSSGSSWSSAGLQDMLFYVYGKATVPDPPQYEQVLRGIRIAIQPKADSPAWLHTRVHVLAAPLLPAAS